MKKSKYEIKIRELPDGGGMKSDYIVEVFDKPRSELVASFPPYGKDSDAYRAARELQSMMELTTGEIVTLDYAGVSK